MNELLEKYADKIEQILKKYPADQKTSGVMPLIHLAQTEEGYITRKTFAEIAQILQMTETEVVSIVGFYTLYHEKSGVTYRLQVCTDLPCALRGADEFLQKLCQNLAVRVGETSADGLFTIEEVTCLAGCDHAPLLQIQSGSAITYHEDLNIQKASALIDELRCTSPEKREK